MHFVYIFFPAQYLRKFEFLILYAFQQCQNFENRLRFDKVTESLKVGTFWDTVYSIFSAAKSQLGWLNL